VLLDIDLGPERALDFIVAAKSAGFNPRILVVTAGASDQEAIQLIQAAWPASSTNTIRRSFMQRHPADCQRRSLPGEEVPLAPVPFGGPPRPATGPKLTNRDRTVLRFILQGLTNREIADGWRYRKVR